MPAVDVGGEGGGQLNMWCAGDSSHSAWTSIDDRRALLKDWQFLPNVMHCNNAWREYISKNASASRIYASCLPDAHCSQEQCS